MRAALVVVACLVSLGAQAQGASRSSLQDIFEAANVAATRGAYEEAVAAYQNLIEAGVRDPDVFFNLGTVHAQSGDYPRAILSYERALSLRPSDTRARDDLREAEQALEEQRAEREGEATIQRSRSISDALYGGVNENALAYALLASNLAFFACLGWAWTGQRRRRLLLLASTASGILLVISALGLAVKSGMFRDGPRAVVLQDRVSLREGPYLEARVRGDARGGDRGYVLRSDRDFVKLRVVSGVEGWVPGTSVGLVDLGDTLH